MTHRKSQTFILTLILALSLHVHGNLRGAVNDRPIIGIFTEPSEIPQASEYIAGSYIKFIEAGGARVVPIKYSLAKDDLVDLLGRINGVLLPGGAAALDPGGKFYDALEVMWEVALKRKDLPVFGTCLGFEALMKLAAHGKPVLRASGKFDAEAYPQPVQLTAEAGKSELLKGLNAEVKSALESQAITYNSHTQGITPEVFETNESLSKLFKVLGYSTDRKGKRFVAMVEARGYPFFGVQFHPEKTNFEWFKPAGIPHSREAIGLSQHLANFFVTQASKNMNRFSTEASVESNALIENYTRKYLGNQYFSEMYLFGTKDEDKPPHRQVRPSFIETKR